MEVFAQLVLNSIIAGSLYALVALGFNFIYSTTKFFNMAHGSVAIIGGYTALYLSKSFDLHIVFCIIIGVLAAGLFGYLSDRVIFRRLRNKKASGTVLLLASIGLMTLVQAIIAMIFSSQFQVFKGIYPESHEILGGVITDIQLYIVLAVIIVSLLLYFIVNYTKFGKMVRVVSDDEEVAKVIGIDTNKVIAGVFFIGSLISGLSGILFGLDTGMDPTLGTTLLFKGVIASIIGGVGSIYGGVLGGLFLGVVENFGVWQISGEWKDTIAFVVLLIFLLFRPSGIIKK